MEKPQGLKIMKVVDLEDSSKYPKINPILMKPPFLLLGIGSVRSGKSNLLINLMRREDMYGVDFFSDCLVISNTINNDPKGKFLKDAFRVEDHYEDRFISELVEGQKKYERSDMPTTLLILDDIINRDFKKNNEVSFLASRFRHYELSLMIFTQSFRAVSTIIRSNATDILIFRQQSSKEMEKIIEEYSDLTGTPERFMDYYNIAMSVPYGFLYIDAQTNPATFYKGFEEKIGEGSRLTYSGTIPQQDSEVFEKKKKK